MPAFTFPHEPLSHTFHLCTLERRSETCIRNRQARGIARQYVLRYTYLCSLDVPSYLSAEV